MRDVREREWRERKRCMPKKVYKMQDSSHSWSQTMLNSCQLEEKEKIVKSNIDSHMKQLIFKLRMSIQICEAVLLNKLSRKFEKMQLLSNTVFTRSYSF